MTSSGFVSKQIVCLLLQIVFVQMVFSLVFMCHESQATIGMLYDKLSNKADKNVRLIAI